MHPNIPLTMLLGGVDPTTGQPTRTTRSILINVARLAYFQETPDRGSLVQMDGGQLFTVREPVGEVLTRVKMNASGYWARFTLAGDDRLLVYVAPDKVNFVVPNPNETTSLQVGGGTVLLVQEVMGNVTRILAGTA